VTSGSWFSDADFIARLTSVEDQFVERKSKSDKGGWLRTTVAFANSTPIGYPAVLFIGVGDDGTIADNVNVGDTMKWYSDVINNGVWPPIYTAPRSLTHTGKSFIAVIIPGSAERPHFVGKSYVRSGTQSIEATEAQYTELIAQRLSKARELLAWKGKQVLVEWFHPRHVGNPIMQTVQATVIDCNQFYVTVENGSPPSLQSYALSNIELNFDHLGNQLKLERNFYGSVRT
jgi:hypothetical protein